MSVNLDKNGEAASRRKRLSLWIKGRKVVQTLALVFFCILLILSRSGQNSVGWIDLVFRFDPLLTLTSMLASRTFLLEASIGLALALLLAVVAGRAWCGWLCPLGTLLDWFNFKKKPALALPEGLRGVKYGLLLVILFAALMGNLSLLLLDPLTIVYRSFTFSLLPALDQLISALEKSLYPIEFFQPAISWLEGLLRPAILPDAPQYFNRSLLFGLVFAGVLLLNLLASRFWCRYLCPLGGFLGLIAKVSIFRRKVQGTCRECSLCARACPTATIDPHKAFSSDAGECILCLECFKGCNDSSLRATAPVNVDSWNRYDPGRRALLNTALISMAGTALIASEGHRVKPDSHCLRPPGSTSDTLLSACTRCGVCMRACPTHILQPAGVNFGLESLWTPVLVARDGYCEYSCNTCGQVCPVHAIPELSLEDKRLQVIGKAYINQNRCLVWSDHRDCIVCEEMCPVPDKAIKVTELEVVDEDGQKRTLKAPYVTRDNCIGCGTCEFKCPVAGEAAIRVYVTNPDALLF